MVEVCGEDTTAFDEVGWCDQDISGQRRERIPSGDKFVLVSQLRERRKNIRQILIDQLPRLVEESVRSLFEEADDGRRGIVRRRSPSL